MDGLLSQLLDFAGATDWARWVAEPLVDCDLAALVHDAAQAHGRGGPRETPVPLGMSLPYADLPDVLVVWLPAAPAKLPEKDLP